MNININQLQLKRNEEIAASIHDTIKLLDGATLNPETLEQPKKGLAVSTGFERFAPLGNFRETEIRQAILEIVQKYFMEKEKGFMYYIGYWRDKDNQRHEFNLTQVFEHEDIAHLAANATGQRYIYDLEKDIEIPTKLIAEGLA